MRRDETRWDWSWYIVSGEAREMRWEDCLLGTLRKHSFIAWNSFSHDPFASDSSVSVLFFMQATYLWRSNMKESRWRSYFVSGEMESSDNKRWTNSLRYNFSGTFRCHCLKGFSYPRCSHWSAIFSRLDRFEVWIVLWYSLYMILYSSI